MLAGRPAVVRRTVHLSAPSGSAVLRRVPSSAVLWHGHRSPSPAARPVLLVGHADLDGLAAEALFTGHVGQSVLLLALRAEPDEAVALGEADFVQDDLGAAHGLVAVREELIEPEVVHFRAEVADPDGGVGFARHQPRRVVIELETNRRVAVGNDFAAQPVHGDDGSLVALKVDESVAGWLAGEAVGHHFDGDDAVLAQGHHGIVQELLVHVGLQATDPQGTHAGHDLKQSIRKSLNPCTVNLVAHAFPSFCYYYQWKILQGCLSKNSMPPVIPDRAAGNALSTTNQTF